MTAATHALTAVDVRYISLAGRPKNGRALILKSDLAGGEVVVSHETAVLKADPVRRMAYGVVYAPDSVDADGHVMAADEIEKAMLGFMAKGRVGAVDCDHDEQTGGAYVAESWLVKGTEAGETLDALFPGEPVGTWCVGIKVEDAATWERVAKGEITGLSFAGVAVLAAVEKAAPVETCVACGGTGSEATKADTMTAEAGKTASCGGRKQICDEGGCWCQGDPTTGPDKQSDDGVDHAELADAVLSLYDGETLPTFGEVRDVLATFAKSADAATADAERVDKARRLHVRTESEKMPAETPAETARRLRVRVETERAPGGDGGMAETVIEAVKMATE